MPIGELIRLIQDIERRKKKESGEYNREPEKKCYRCGCKVEEGRMACTSCERKMYH